MLCVLKNIFCQTETSLSRKKRKCVFQCPIGFLIEHTQVQAIHPRATTNVQWATCTDAHCSRRHHKPCQALGHQQSRSASRLDGIVEADPRLWGFHYCTKIQGCVYCHLQTGISTDSRMLLLASVRYKILPGSSKHFPHNFWCGPQNSLNLGVTQLKMPFFVFSKLDAKLVRIQSIL